MMTRKAIFLMLFLPSAAAFAANGLLGAQGTQPSTAPGSEALTLEGCFIMGGGDPGFRSGCLMNVAAAEKDVSLCDLIEIPGMVRDCIDGVAAVTTFEPNRCQILNEKYRDHCLRAAKH